MAMNSKLPQLSMLRPKKTKAKMTPMQKVAKVKAVRGGPAPMPAPAQAAMRIGGKARF